MNKQVYKQNLTAGIIVLLVAAAAFALTFEMPGNAFLFPRVASTILFILGFALCALSLYNISKNAPTEKQSVRFQEVTTPFFTLLMVLAYVLGIKYIGFYTSTIVMMAGYMYFMGIRSVKTLFTVTIIVTIFVYLLFSMQLNVPLPKGIIL